tara:strand:- start:227 stop:358 length:132 start_codon:yes stop_codon:yes gene_type:complete
MKTIRISKLVYEMLMVVSKKNKPSMNPEAMVEELIENQYRRLK